MQPERLRDPQAGEHTGRDDGPEGVAESCEQRRQLVRAQVARLALTGDARAVVADEIAHDVALDESALDRELQQ